jgi:uncharacterized membrane protein YedE/YeeE
MKGDAAMNSNVRPFWPPLAAGVSLGAVLLLTFLLTGHGLGASGSFTGFTAWLGGAVAHSSAQANAYLGPMLAAGHPLAGWISWEVVGVLVGALLAAITGGRFRLKIDGPTRLGAGNRLLFALAGGVLTGFGARLARGCTSGLGLSGGAPLAVSAFLFLIGFFVVGILMGRLTRRVWV